MLLLMATSPVTCECERAFNRLRIIHTYELNRLSLLYI